MQLHRAGDELQATGAGICMIGQATPRQAAHFRRRMGLEWPVLADGKRRSYKAAGAKIATLNELVGPRVVAKGLVTSARSRVVQGRTIGHPAQLGGAMIVLPDGSIPWSHMSEDASDNASPAELLQALRSADGPA